MLLLSLIAVLLSSPGVIGATVPPSIKRPHLDSYFGTSPKIDGTLDPNEWSDATEFRGVLDWVPEFNAVKSASDLALRGWVKHDRRSLYFAFEITDDLLYGIDTPRWLPTENPAAHSLSGEGFPWFGDELEILINAPNTWTGDENCAGDGMSWQMVCNLTKSRLGGIGKGGLLEGEPRSELKAWKTYASWIAGKAQRAAVTLRPGGKGYFVEWAIDFRPCVELGEGRFYDVQLGTVTVGLNIALGDLDRPEDGKGNFGQFNHEQWWAGAPHSRTQKNNFGTLTIHGRSKNPLAKHLKKN